MDNDDPADVPSDVLRTLRASGTVYFCDRLAARGRSRSPAFAKTFRKHTGVTPTAWRRSGRPDGPETR